MHGCVYVRVARRIQYTAVLVWLIVYVLRSKSPRNLGTVQCFPVRHVNVSNLRHPVFPFGLGPPVFGQVSKKKLDQKRVGRGPLPGKRPCRRPVRLGWGHCGLLCFCFVAMAFIYRKSNPMHLSSTCSYTIILVAVAMTMTTCRALRVF